MEVILNEKGNNTLSSVCGPLNFSAIAHGKFQSIRLLPQIPVDNIHIPQDVDFDGDFDGFILPPEDTLDFEPLKVQELPAASTAPQIMTGAGTS